MRTGVTGHRPSPVPPERLRSCRDQHGGLAKPPLDPSPSPHPPGLGVGPLCSLTPSSGSLLDAVRAAPLGCLMDAHTP